MEHSGDWDIYCPESPMDISVDLVTSFPEISIIEKKYQSNSTKIELEDL